MHLHLPMTFDTDKGITNIVLKKCPANIFVVDYLFVNKTIQLQKDEKQNDCSTDFWIYFTK